SGEVDELCVATSDAGANDLVVAGGVGLVLQHQVVAVAEQHLLVGAAHRLERVLAVGRRAPLGVPGGGTAEGVGDTLEAALERREEEVALAREEAEDVRLSDADATRDPLHGRAVQPAVGELVHGGRDQLLAPLGRGDAPARGLDGGIHVSLPTTTGACPPAVSVPAPSGRSRRSPEAMPARADSAPAGTVRAAAPAGARTRSGASSPSGSSTAGVRKGSSSTTSAPAASTATPTQMAGIGPSTKACGVV